MHSDHPLRLAASLRVVPGPEQRDALAHAWVSLFTAWNALPLLLPNAFEEVEILLEAWSTRALVLTGGNTPRVPGTGLADQPSALRDARETRALRWALERGLPVLGVCRGAQFLNLHFGGGLRRCEDDAHAGTHHHLVGESTWGGRFDGVVVNSHHAWCLPPGQLAPGLVADARAEDGGVEAFHHETLPVLGLMWHPERDGGRPADLATVLSAFLRGASPWRVEDETRLGVAEARP